MKYVIDSKEATSLAAIYFFSGLTCIGKYNFAGRNAWLSLLIAALLGILLIFLFHKVAGFLEKSRLIIVLLALLALGLIGFYVHLITQFLTACVLPNTSPWITGSMMLLTAMWFGYKGLQPLGQFCKLLMSALAGLLLLLFTIPLACIDMFYVDAVLQIPDSPWIFQNSLISKDSPFMLSIWFFTGTYFLKGILLVSLFRLSKNNISSAFRPIKNGILITAPILSLVTLSTVLSLGPAVYDMLSYPIYYPLSLIESGEHILHFEVIFLIIYMFSELAQLGALFVYIKLAFQRIVNFPAM